ncbi:MAG: ABC transporter permease [Clostridiales bacterium]|nr:ABC transporter permease [Clostridiales bacterium]
MKNNLLYILKKFLIMILIMFLASFLIFVAMRLNNVDEVSLVGSAKRMTEENRIALTEEYNLDKPLVQRYFLWLGDALHGDFGVDYETKTDVKAIVASKIPITAGLVIMSMVISIVVAIPLGILCAVKRNSRTDTLLSTVMLILTSIPSFLAGLIVLVIITVAVPGYQIVGTYSNLSEYFARISVPSVVLALGLLASFARITRSSMIEQLKSEYVTAAEAKGMGRLNVVITHAFHNGCLPVLTTISLTVGLMISGTVMIEEVFTLPGIGSCLVDAVQTYNYPLVQFLTLIMLGVFLLISFLVDIIYSIVDPRITRR